MITRFLLLCLLCPLSVLACVDHGKDENSIRFSVFDPMLGNTMPEWLPFCYSERYLHVYPEDISIFDIDIKQNYREWIDYLGGEVAVNDVEDILYRTNPDDFLYAARCQEWNTFAGNTFVAALRKHPSALSYIVFAKRQESINDNQETADDIWESDRWREYTDTSAIKRLWQDLETAMQTSADDIFLQQRYAFQLMRIGDVFSQNVQYPQLRYGSAYITRVYDECLRNEKSILQPWALPYLAKAQQAQWQNVQANLTTALAFDQCESKKVWAYQRLSYGELTRLLPQTRNSEEKKAVLALKCFKNKAQALKDLKALYHHDPETRYLHLLINREVNKLESWLLSAEKGTNNCEMVRSYDMYAEYKDQVEMGYAYKNCIKDEQYAIELLQFVRSLPAKAWRGNEAYRHLVLAHLCLLTGDYATAWQHTCSIPKKCSKAYRTQQVIEEAMILARLQNIESPATQQAIYERLRIIAAKRIKTERYNYNDEEENHDTLEELLDYLSQIFANKNNVAMQGLLKQRSDGLRNESVDWYSKSYYTQIEFWDIHAQPKYLDDVLRFKHKKNKTPFEQFISPKKWADDGVYYEIQGTLYFRQNNYAAAAKSFNRVPSNFWEQHDYEEDYSFYCPSSNELMEIDADSCPNGDKDVWTKKDIAQEALRLEQNLAKPSNPDRALHLYQMGNLHFNTSYWGESWQMYDYGRSLRDHAYDYGKAMYTYSATINSKQSYRGKADMEQKLKRYYTCQTAIAYYKQALRLSQNDPELQAKIYLMLHTFLYKQYGDNQVLYEEADKNPPKPFEHEYFRTFSKKFKHTRAYQIWKTVCEGAG